MEKSNIPFKPIKINCQVCKGTKKADAKFYQDFFSIPLEERDLIEPEDVKVPCWNCNAKGYTEVKNL
jgi:hypothetical protein